MPHAWQHFPSVGFLFKDSSVVITNVRIKMMDQQVEETFASLMAMLDYLSPEQRAVVRRAFEFSRDAHGNQRRKSGRPYILHPLAVAQTLASLHMDAPTLAASLLHDVIEDTPVTYEQMEATFGQEIAGLVAGVTKL